MEISYRDPISKRLTFQVKSDEGLNLGSASGGKNSIGKRSVDISELVHPG